jgi:integral membrane sensor domain MASE1
MYTDAQVPWVWATRALCLLILAAACLLVRTAWRRRALLKREDFT